MLQFAVLGQLAASGGGTITWFSFYDFWIDNHLVTLSHPCGPGACSRVILFRRRS
jgi:hypothetical protein